MEIQRQQGANHWVHSRIIRPENALPESIQKSLQSSEKKIVGPMKPKLTFTKMAHITLSVKHAGDHMP